MENDSLDDVVSTVPVSLAEGEHAWKENVAEAIAYYRYTQTLWNTYLADRERFGAEKIQWFKQGDEYSYMVSTDD